MKKNVLAVTAAAVCLSVAPYAGHAQAKSSYGANDRIEIMSQTGKWYPATIKTVVGRGGYLIRYDDGTEMIEHESANMRLVSKAAPQAGSEPRPLHRGGASTQNRPKPAAKASSSDLSEMSLTDLGILATERFTEFPERACPAAQEYARRGEKNTKSGGVEVVLGYCRRLASTSSQASAAGATPPMGRYTCLRTGFMSNEVAPDLKLMPGGKYESLGRVGAYRFEGGSNRITWLSGSLATAKTNWIGVYVPPGQGARFPTVVIRDLKDVTAGNKRDLQWCNHAA